MRGCLRVVEKALADQDLHDTHLCAAIKQVEKAMPADVQTLYATRGGVSDVAPALVSLVPMRYVLFVQSIA